MFLLNSNSFKFLYSPDDSTGKMNIAPPIGGTDKDDTIKFLGEDDPEDEIPEEDKIDITPKKKTVEVDKDEEDVEPEDGEEEDTDDDDDIEKLLEPDDEEPSEEQLELTVPVRRKEILKKYPEIFKDFPYLEKAYYREQQFTQIFPDINDAKQAVEAKGTLDRFESELMDGKIETIFSAVKAENGNSFYKIVDELLPTLARVDEGAYHHVLGNTIKHTIIAMLNESRESGNEALKAAAQILNQFTFGNSKFTPPSRLSKEEADKVDPKETEIKQREQALVQHQFESARGEINNRINRSLKETIEANIDPKNSMSDYVKRNAIREVTENLGSLVKQDKRFGEIIEKLWEQSHKKGFTKEMNDKIVSAYRSKARTLLPSVIKKARNEALRGMGKRVREEADETPVEKQEIKERPRSKQSSGNNESKGVPRGMSTLEFLSK